MTLSDRLKIAIPLALVVGIGMRILVLNELSGLPASAVSIASAAAAAAAVVVFLRHNRRKN